jgi:hypothetical protein
MVGDVGNRESGVLEQARRPDEPGHGEIPLRRRNTGPEEPAHHGARQNPDLSSE